MQAVGVTFSNLHLRSTWGSYKKFRCSLSISYSTNVERFIVNSAMWMWLSLFIPATLISNVPANSYRDCGKFFNPHNYMDQLPSLNLPYVSSVNYMPPIKPSPVLKTKVINVITKYVYQNPICVKISGKKSPCKSLNENNNMEFLVTKEYFVKDRKTRRLPISQDDLDVVVEGSEEPRPFGAATQSKTPGLSSEQVKDMLIEDRLDQLETILPHYTRKRVYETSTITVTKVRSNNRATATLLVKNCVPQGYELCPPKARRRKSKVAQVSDDRSEGHYYG